MKKLRNLRIALSLVLLAASIALLLGVGLPEGLDSMPPSNERQAQGFLGWAMRLQVIPSALGVTIGATLFWLLSSFFIGRAYCAICPLGAFLDLPRWLRLRLGRARPFRYQQRKPVAVSVFLIYLATLTLGQLGWVFLTEPWNIMRNMVSVADTGAIGPSWLAIGASSLFGVAAGVVSLIGLLAWGWFSGREFCASICPVGTGLGLADGFSAVKLQIDPDRCISCMKCEDRCPTQCIKVAARMVDDTRCVRCLECLPECPADALIFAGNRKRPATPMLRKGS